jgi:hypothetical protein
MIPIVDVQGKPFERGLMQGSLLSQELKQAPEILASLPLGPRWLPGRRWAALAGITMLGRHYLRCHHRPLAERFDGAALAGLRGLAEGSRLPAPRIYGVGAFECESANLPFALGCTALAFGAGDTRDGTPRLAYNHDFPQAFASSLRLRRSAPAGLYRSLAITYPPLLGCICGLNERGLAVTVNQAYATDLSRTRPSVFVTQLLQECLDRAASLAEALAILEAAPIASGALVTLVDAAGDRACVELAATRLAVRRAPALLHAFNKYRAPEMEEVEIPVGAVATGLAAGHDIHACNVTRQDRFGALEHGPRDDEAIFALLADHDGGAGDSGTICRHDDPLSETILSAVMNPRARTLSYIAGQACRGNPITISL